MKRVVTLLIFAALAIAPAAAVEVTAPATVEACSGQLIEVSAKTSFTDGVVKLKVQSPADLDYRQIGDTLVFAAGPPRTITIMAIDATNTPEFDFDVELVTIEVAGAAPKPEPEPEPDDPPEPPATGDISETAKRLTLVVDAAYRAHGDKLAANYEWAAAAAGDRATVEKELTARNRVALAGNSKEREAWLPWFVGMAELFVGASDFKAACKDAAAGIRAAIPAPAAKPVVKSPPAVRSPFIQTILGTGPVLGVRRFDGRMRPATQCEINGTCTPRDGYLIIGQ